MAAIVKSSPANCIFYEPRHPSIARKTRRNKAVWCMQKQNKEVVFKRRQMLLASTSTSPLTLIPTNPNQTSNLTDLQKLQSAQKLNKFKYSSGVDVASLVSSPNSSKGVSGAFSGMVSVPSQHLSLGNYDFVQAKVKMDGFEKESEADLVIEGIKVEREKALWFDVYIRPACREEEDEYAGSFIHLPPPQSREKGTTLCSLRIEISDILDDFDSEHRGSFIVTLVPKFNTHHLPITAQNICIQKS